MSQSKIKAVRRFVRKTMSQEKAKYYREMIEKYYSLSLWHRIKYAFFIIIKKKMKGLLK